MTWVLWKVSFELTRLQMQLPGCMGFVVDARLRIMECYNGTNITTSILIFIKTNDVGLVAQRVSTI
jgi:hypothetical protein